MRITFLGTGTSQGVPIIGCTCEVCESKSNRDKRLRCAIHVQTAHTSIVVDAGPDFRQQMLTNKVLQLDAILFTHSHKDHVAGFDDVRAYNYILQKPIDAYANAFTLQELMREFPYIFNGTNYPGIPQVNTHTIDVNKAFTIGDVHIQPVEVMHHKLPVVGFIFNKQFAYITDANYIAPLEMKKLLNVEYLVLNALRHDKHISHFSLPEAIEVANIIQAKKTYFTHISHQLGCHNDLDRHLPESMQLAYDGLQLHL